MKKIKRWYPKLTLGNRNVPEGVKIIGSFIKMSGEIIDTYFEKDGKIYVVSNWVGDQPRLVSPKEVPKIKS